MIRLIVLACLLVAGVSHAQEIQVTVSSADAILDGTPRDFDLKQFTARLDKSLAKKLDEKSDKNGTASKLILSIDSMGHKLRPFHFKSQYVAKYSYKLVDHNQKTILDSKNDQVNEDQIDLIDEIVEDIANKVLKP